MASVGARRVRPSPGRFAASPARAARRDIIVDSAVPDPPLPQIGRYVTLYNIDSEAIDKTLIDMLMATRKMESRQRSTDPAQSNGARLLP